MTTSGAGGLWQSEVVWNDDNSGSGGGPADDGTGYFGIPSWQVPVINSSNGGSTTLRNSPDVALQADFDNYICYDRGFCETDWGGTSFATPRWAAWLALVNQQLVADGRGAGLGFINPTLYSIGQSANYNSDFHDITVGNNDTDGQSTFYYAVAGYDLVTGWGSMNGQHLMTTLIDGLVEYTLTVIDQRQRSMTSTDGFINCPGTCSHNYPDNTPVTLNASPAQAGAFSGWSGACTGTRLLPCDHVAEHHPSRLPSPASRHADGIGRRQWQRHQHRRLHQLSRHLQPYLYAEYAGDFECRAAQGWSLSGWTGACMGVGPCNVTMTQNQAVTAVFVEPGHGIQFVPVTPCRLVDTRQTQDPITGGTSQSYILPQLGGCNIPASAAAYSLNVTVVPITRLGYLTIWPTGEAQPVVSTMNSGDGRIKANAAIVPAGTNGAVSVFVTDTTNVILDIDGYFTAPGSGTYQFYPLTPCRLVDTRNGQDRWNASGRRGTRLCDCGNLRNSDQRDSLFLQRHRATCHWRIGLSNGMAPR